MSRRGSAGDRGLLLDTSFLLPILGFESSDRVMGAFEKLGFYELYYSDISVLEALWKIVKVIEGTEEEISRIEGGLRAINETMKNARVNGEALRNAILMYRLGHRDIIDNILYSIALARKLRLLTVDKQLLEFIEEHGLPREAVVTPEEL